MIRAEIRDDGDFGADAKPVEMFELKAAEFQHDPISRFDLINHRQQAATNVAA